MAPRPYDLVFRTFVLERTLAGYRLFHPQFRVLFNSYYVAVGPRHPRPERGMLSRPALAEVLTYREHVDEQMRRLFERDGIGPDCLEMIELGIHHEQQHQELIVTDLKHLLSRNPLKPVYVSSVDASTMTARPLEWIGLPDGIRQVGHEGPSFAFDNEQPRHRDLSTRTRLRRGRSQTANTPLSSPMADIAMPGTGFPKAGM